MKMDWKNNPKAVSILVKMYPDHTLPEIAAAIGFPCTRLAANKKAQELRLAKSEAFFVRHPECRKMNKRNSDPETELSRISHPKPGVTIHRIM